MKAKRAFYALSVACVGIVILMGVVMYTGNQMLQKQAAKIAQARAEDEASTEQIVRTTQLESKINELGEVDKLAQKFLPEEKNQTVVVAEIYKYARETGVKLNNIDFSATTDKPSDISQTEVLKEAKNVRIFPFTSSITCISPDKLIEFLTKLEQNRRKMQITSLGVQRVEETTDECSEGNLSISDLKIEVYLKSETPTAQTPAKTN